MVIVPGLRETVGMAERKLTEVTYPDAVPTFGRCSQCRRPFYGSPEKNQEKAARDFYAVFEKHTCDEDASQAAVRESLGN